MVRRRCASQDQMRNEGSIFDSILLGKEAAETSAAYDNLRVWSSKVFPHPFNIVNDLLKGVGLGARALAMSAVVE